MTTTETDKELNRILNLADYNLDYDTFQGSFNDLARLAANVAGTEISLVNLIDSYTQWTVAGYGYDVEQMPRDESVCNHTIREPEFLEIPDLKADSRFQTRDYVANEPSLRYYYGIPLNSDGHHIGALCVLDRAVKPLSPEQAGLLKIIAGEIVTRLKAYKHIDTLRKEIQALKDKQKRLAHDIRGPVGGIVGLAQLICDQGTTNDIDEVLEFAGLIQKSGNSVIELADGILASGAPASAASASDDFTLSDLRDKLIKLYKPQAMMKDICFTVASSGLDMNVPVAKNKLLQIAGNLISNAIKFTPVAGTVETKLGLQAVSDDSYELIIQVRDSGVGLDKDEIVKAVAGKNSSSGGTVGEKGFGFGLALVKHLVDALGGTMNIESVQGDGAVFEVRLPGTR